MLDPKLIRKDPDHVKKGLLAKGHDPGGVDQWLELDEKRRELLRGVESLKADRNTQSQEIGRIKKEGKDTGASQTLVREMGETRQAPQEFH